MFGSSHEKFVWPRPYPREIYIATRYGVELTQMPEINHLGSPFESILVRSQSKLSPKDVITRALVFRISAEGRGLKPRGKAKCSCND